MSFKLTGLKEVDAKLEQLGKVEAAKIVRKAARTSMKEVQKEAKANAPRGETGDLARNIKVRAGKRKRDTIIINVQVGDEAFDNFYPKFVEFGTKAQPPQSYMRRAHDTKEEQVKKQAIAEIKKGIDKAVSK